MKIPEPQISKEADLICETLCREIIRASRWQAVKLAWDAMLQVRRMEKELTDEGMIDKTTFEK